MRAKITRLSPITRLLPLFLLWIGSGVAGVAGDERPVTVHWGADPAGQRIVLVVPPPAHESSIGIARQIATVPLQQGSLTVIEAKRPPTVDQLGDFMTEALPGQSMPDWIWVHQGAIPTDHRGQEVTSPTIRLQAANDEDLRRTIRRTLGDQATVVSATPESTQQVATQGVLSFAYPPGTPVSRQIRYTRLLVTSLLRSAGLMADADGFCWQRLADRTPQLVALYDAQGIGSGGPVNLERIVAERLADVGIYRICGEDIREGALAPAAGTIFPGGSGRGIGDGLQAEGRELLREFISAGGGYLGVCAGAYFAASGLENYLQAIRLKHSQPWTRGRGSIQIELTDEGQALFGDTARVLTTRYANGPVFLAAEQAGGGDPAFVVLARFKTPSTDSRGNVHTEMVGEAAIGAVEYGRGRILIISPHPESHREHHPLVARAIQWTLRTTPPRSSGSSRRNEFWSR